MSLKSCQKIFHRKFSSRFKHDVTSKIVRDRFIEFFQDNTHSLIRSSSVVPFNDPTIPFINAGMCQFKHILTGEMMPPHRRVVNSQKCIRVSGKHNDLNLVGLDGHHLTFFEMLGSWSFNDYFKETACQLAWELLTTPPFSLDKNRLYFTYFSGAPSLSLPPDLETKEIWTKIGVPENQIFGMGLEDNFWEMSRIGPCGPCTEILMDCTNKIHTVTHPSQLTELWNIVFIQYNRRENGTLENLPASHVDTGMGLERILAVLQNKTSNYDTDLFIPLFETIHKVTGVRSYKGKFGGDDIDGIDTAYRRLADHCRMITVAMGDGMFPDTNAKLRRILRRSLTIPERYFKLESGSSLVIELINKVVESLASVYPEIQTNLNQVVTLTKYEAEILKSLQKSSEKEWNRLLTLHPELCQIDVQSMLSIVNAYEDTKKQMKSKNIDKGDYLPPDLVVRLFDTFGLDLEAAHDLGDVLGFKINREDFNDEFHDFKSKSKERTLNLMTKSKLPLSGAMSCLQKSHSMTEDLFKYNYCVNSQETTGYKFNNLNAKLLAVIRNNQIVYSSNPLKDVGDKEYDHPSSKPQTTDLSSLCLKNGEELLFIFDKTCFYSEAGGQESDRGYFTFKSVDDLVAKVSVGFVKNHCGYVIHYGRVELPDDKNDNFIVKTPCNVCQFINEDHRLGNMKNHSAVHILHALLAQGSPVVAQRSSRVTADSLTFDFSLYGSKLEQKDAKSIEERFKQVIESSIPVERTVLPGEKLISSGAKFLPGEVYPYKNISVISMDSKNFSSKEACCGTHVLITRDIEDFVITKLKINDRIYSISAVTGKKADLARSNSNRIISKMKNCDSKIKELSHSTPAHLNMLPNLQDDLKDLEAELSESQLTVSVYNDVQQFVEMKLRKKIKQFKRALFIKDAKKEISQLVNSGEQRTCFVHFLSKNLPSDKVALSEVLDDIPLNRPILIFCYIDKSLRAECIVPQAFVSNHFNAKTWMDAVASILGKPGFSRKEENPNLNFHFEKKMNLKDVQQVSSTLVEKAILKAEEAIGQ